MTQSTDVAAETQAPAAGQAAPDTVPPYSWYALSVLVLVYVLNFIDRQILSILANDIKADFGLSDEYLGFLYGTAFAVFYALFGIPLGRLADSWKRLRLMSFGLALWSMMTALSGFTKNGTQLTLARVGVGVGEASASPAAYSLISDYFPPRLRATALSIYSSGLYIGGGLSLLIGGLIVEKWNAAFPGGGPLGLAGWQAAFVAVGLPGLLLAVWVLTLREPVRGAMDGIESKPVEKPFAGFFQELFTVIPPFTFIGAARRGLGALAVNVAVAASIFAAGYVLTSLLGSGAGRFISAISDQWLFLGVGLYSVFCWGTELRGRDAATFKLIWGSPAFLTTVLAYSTVAFMAYSVSYWGAPYAERTFDIPKSELGFWIGGPGAAAGFLGVILGGAIADALQKRFPSGRVWVILFGMVMPLPAMLIMFTTDNQPVFYIANFFAGTLAATALGAAAATTQTLVLPRMRATATATFFIGTTLLGLGLGPYLAGYVSARNGDDLGIGVLSTIGIVPIGLIAVLAAIKLVPAAIDTMRERAKAAGEPNL
ncbi:MFS transporter [Erythrobacter sp. W53]|uniref:MFS transporter n=1 Tax=Erythrobacter sp. W53 TaxID=3425947 RepID=UPI003D766C02